MEILDEETLKINITNINDLFSIGCGYCKHQTVPIKNKFRNDFKMTLNQIPIDIYQHLINKGWTRCGNRFYKRNYEKCCCKLYQPRLNINNFKISKEQKKVMKRFKKYLQGDLELNKMYNVKFNMNNVDNQNNHKEKIKEEDPIQNKIFNKLKIFISLQKFRDILKKYIQNQDDINEIYQKTLSTKIRSNNNKKMDYDYSCDLIFIIKNVLISLRKKNITDNKFNINVIENKIKNIQLDDINEVSENFINEIKNEFINFYKYEQDYKIISFNEKTGHINFKIVNKNNINIINKEPKIPKQEKNAINKINEINNKKEKYIFDYFKEIVDEPDLYLPLKHIYTLELTDKIHLEATDERFLLYKKYQLRVHKEYPTIDSYNNFIGLTPLIIKKEIKYPDNFIMKTKHPAIYPKYYGTYNLIHRIDGIIIAVTCIDILPNYMLSCYCYYDPDWSFLDLGVFTAIREIEYMKSFQELIDKNFMYYSMEEMSQSVTKLKYKGNYFPTEIVDHYSEKYVFLTDEVKAIIGDNECHGLTPQGKNKNIGEYFTPEEINYYYNTIIIDVFGEQIMLEDFLNLYIEDYKKQNNIRNNLRKFMEIIDINTFSKIRFYFDGSFEIMI